MCVDIYSVCLLSSFGFELERERRKGKSWSYYSIYLRFSTANAAEGRICGAVGIAGLYIGRLRNCLPFLTSFTQCRMANLHIKCFHLNGL